MESEKKELRKCLHYVKIKHYTNPCLTRNYLNGLGVGMGVLAQSLQLTHINLEPSTRIKGEREPESARNEISGLIPRLGSSFGIYRSNSELFMGHRCP